MYLIVINDLTLCLIYRINYPPILKKGPYLRYKMVLTIG